MKYIIPGNPIPLARARHGNRRTWDSQKAIKFGWGVQLQNQHCEKKLYQGPLLLDINFFIEIPQTYKKKFDLLCGTYFDKRPDLSNLVKFVEDVATGILYHDDCSISRIITNKFYDDGKGPRTEFTIIELASKDKNERKKTSSRS